MAETLQQFTIEDELFASPFVDVDEERSEPVPHRYVHGGFEGTSTRFSYYFPPAEQYRGRFYQHHTPVPESEHLAPGLTGVESKIGFAFASGAFFVETNGGGAIDLSKADRDEDPTISAYRANAAAAQYAKHIAQSVYGAHHTFAYSFGGSGGAYRTIGCAEHTRGVWDGFVPYVVGSPVALPNVFTVRMHAMRVLRDFLDEIVDAVEPGGPAGTIDALAEEQRDAFLEVTRMGFPPRSWVGHRTMGTQAFGVLYGALVAFDPTYFEDFWTVPGYLGADPSASVHRDRVRHSSRIAQVYTRAEAAAQRLLVGLVDGPSGGVDEAFKGPEQGGDVVVAFRIADAPALDPMNAVLTVRSGTVSGLQANIEGVRDDLVIVNFPDLVPGLRDVRAGDEIEIDNSNFLAAQTYHRHQVPAPEFAVFDQFRNADGSPKFPQRQQLLGPIMSRGASGSVQSGDIDAKMILIESMQDREAFAWQADWYRSKVRERLGSRADDTLRVWMTDHALHGDVTWQEHPTHTVSYLGSLQIALRQLAAWVEEGVEPSPSTEYAIEDGQVVVPSRARDRLGVQPTVSLVVDGGDRVEVAVGQPVELRLRAEAPPSAGWLVSAEWAFDDADPFDAEPPVDPTLELELVRQHAFDYPGTHFVTARVALQADGVADELFARQENLARVRVVVSES